MKRDASLRRVLAIAGMTAITVLVSSTTSQAAAQANPAISQQEIKLQNQLLTIHYHRQTGTMDIEWRDGHKLLGITSGARLEDGRQLSTATYTEHELDRTPHAASATAGHEYTIRSTAPGQPGLLQHIWIYDGKPWIAIEAELDPKDGAVGTRHFDAVMLKGSDTVQIGESKSLRVLHVPFDNDMWFRYNSVSAADLKPSQLVTSDEVTALYDNTSRQALILGSISHDTWKTAIEAHAADGQLTDLDIYGGISSPTGVRTDTHDTVPHGIVHGTHVISPRIFIGSFSDWRDGLEAYGAANAAIHAPLKWAEGAPMGWNSWASYAEKIDDRRYLGSAAFVRDTLVPLGFGNHKVVYINFDAFWSKLDAVQLTDAVATIKAMHGADGTRFEPGIYWTPFAYWSDDLDAYVEGTNMKYRYRDILLKAPDGSLLPKVDGGLAIDPSHPGAKARAAYYLQQFQKLGFQYLKIDFLSHGALEGVHFDPVIQTGIQAYNLGMKQIVDVTGNRMFLSLSIAPLFPSGYGHARRLSCDTKGHISGGDQSTEYMLNSLTYGWWTSKNLYITDPDHVVLGEKADQGARNVDEGKSRLLSAIISGGMVLDSSRLADDPQGRELAQAVYNNRPWLAVGAEEKTFRPIEGNTGDKATDAFVRASSHGVYVAFFNYDEKHAQTITIPLDRIDKSLASAGSVAVIDVASGAKLDSAHGDVSVKLSPSASTLVELRWK
ncbi:carbohydrate binding family 6 [Granulicella mallensis]|uniref:Carbohydrate binding family 6 n=1 Tax=Granulicella mallensis (strain ATCC BAA-1857 / DSM 23137 / MP5ACTX8) TaxID=682795 RepID=G8P1V0_GRAMM|nr:carbohydrate binding family 6 [Granulicella mallensis]AEU37002.1 carbohydrate binding family 6 [Granulicella mallensis MP5ACTX8]